MKIVEVVPVAKGITRQSLSYFSKDTFTPGQFVKIPLKGSSALGIVVSTEDASTAKASIKDASFALKKLTKVESAGSLSKAFMEAAERTAKFYATTTGSVLGGVLPKKFLQKPELLGKSFERTDDARKEVKLIQLTHPERFREYRGIVRENFAREKSLIFIVPTIKEVDAAKELLSLGIEQYVYTPKTFDKAKTDRHPVLFITTPSHIIFDRKDLATIIVERENSKAYNTLARPYMDIKKFFINYAKSRGLNLVLGDSVLSLESLWRERESEYAEFSPLSWRLKYPHRSEVVDMRKSKEFKVISPKLEESVRETLNEGQRVFLFALRKGSAPTTVCEDCGSVLLCKNCSSPMVLHDGPVYICHHCMARRSAETRCDTCQSWKLKPLGIGIERVETEMKDLFPDAPKGSIVIGTESALQDLEKAALVGVVSLDSLFSIPNFSINERIFYLITKLREKCSHTFVIQTRNAGERVVETAASGNVLDFYRDEIKEREGTQYPPFSIFIKVTTGGTREKIEKKASYLQTEFKDFEPHFMLGKELSMILRLPRSEWPNEEIVKKLLLLTPEFLIKVDPESIL